MSHPVDELMSEHRLIERMLAVLQTRMLHADCRTFPVEFVEKALDFFVNFAGHRHHEKEEQILFPAMAAAGVARQGGPIGTMEYEHTVARGCLGIIRANLAGAKHGSPVAVAAIREAVEDYTRLLQAHIQKEDSGVYGTARKVLRDERQMHAMSEEFRDVDNPYLTDEFRRRYEALVEKCEAEVPAAA